MIAKKTKELVVMACKEELRNAKSYGEFYNSPHEGYAMTKEELEKATGQELIDERNYCGVDGYYGDYLDNVNEEMLKRFNRLAELEAQVKYWKSEYDKLFNED